MGKELIKKIDELNDSQAVQLFMFFGEKLLEGLEEEDLTKKIDPGLKNNKHLDQIIKLDPNLALKNLSPAESSAVARKYLLYIADDVNLSPLLEKAMGDFKEKPVLVVETILAIGFVASLLIFASSTEIKGKVGKTSFKKGKASPALVKALLEPFVKIIDKL